MRQFDELWEVARRLNSSGGCPWDIKQTFLSLQPYVLEEAHEVVEAIDRGNDLEIIEELGDLLYTVLFYAKVAQREKKFSIEEILDAVKEKLIRRHPHVFGEIQGASEEDVIRNWDLIKKELEGKTKKEFLKELPALAKAQKMIKTFKKSHFPDSEEVETSSEEGIAAHLWEVVKRAEESGIDSEGALRRLLLKKQEAFQRWEASHENN